MSTVIRRGTSARGLFGVAVKIRSGNRITTGTGARARGVLRVRNNIVCADGGREKEKLKELPRGVFFFRFIFVIFILRP